MPSVFTHAAIPLALWCASERGRISTRLLGAGVIAAMLPDADVLAFALHIPYADGFGHRGASHSLLFAMLLAALALPFAKALQASRIHLRRVASLAGCADLRRPGRRAVVAVERSAPVRAVAAHPRLAVCQ